MDDEAQALSSYGERIKGVEKDLDWMKKLWWRLLLPVIAVAALLHAIDVFVFFSGTTPAASTPLSPIERDVQ